MLAYVMTAVGTPMSAEAVAAAAARKYVADYYEARDKPRAVAWRLEHAIQTYPKIAKTDDIVWRMAMAYDEAEEQADAARAYATYIESFPKGLRIADAKRRLEAIRKAVNPPSADPSD